MTEVDRQAEGRLACQIFIELQTNWRQSLREALFMPVIVRRYKCEISLEGPTFETEFREKDLIVYGKLCAV